MQLLRIYEFVLYICAALITYLAKKFNGNHLGEDGGYTLLVLSVAGSADKNVMIVLWLHSRHTSRILAETKENSSGQY